LNKLIPLLAFSILLLAFLGTNQEAEAADMTFTTDTTITTDMTIASGELWVVENGVTLTIDPGVTITVEFFNPFTPSLVNEGTINNFGTIDNSGVIFNFGTINNFGTIINIVAFLINFAGGIINNSGLIESDDGHIDNGGGFLFGSLGGTINNSGLIERIDAFFGNQGGTINNICNGTISPNQPLGTINQIPCSPEICDNFLDDDGDGLVDGDDLECQVITPPPGQSVAGEIIPIEQTSLILAGTQSFSWMIPVILSVLGIGLFVFRKSENS